MIGDFNGWDPSRHLLHKRADESGIWEGFIDRAHAGMRTGTTLSPNTMTS